MCFTSNLPKRGLMKDELAIEKQLFESNSFHGCYSRYDI
jgi:hypothetical protein